MRQHSASQATLLPFTSPPGLLGRFGIGPKPALLTLSVLLVHLVLLSWLADPTLNVLATAPATRSQQQAPARPASPATLLVHLMVAEQAATVGKADKARQAELAEEVEVGSRAEDSAQLREHARASALVQPGAQGTKAADQASSRPPALGSPLPQPDSAALPVGASPAQASRVNHSDGPPAGWSMAAWREVRGQPAAAQTLSNQAWLMASAQPPAAESPLQVSPTQANLAANVVADQAAANLPTPTLEKATERVAESAASTPPLATDRAADKAVHQPTGVDIQTVQAAGSARQLQPALDFPPSNVLLYEVRASDRKAGHHAGFATRPLFARQNQSEVGNEAGNESAQATGHEAGRKVGGQASTGTLIGRSEIHWKMEPKAEPRGEPQGYSLRWLTWLPGRPEIVWHSQGQVDEAGLAPRRMVDWRRQRPVAAVNFQRDVGLISFSGPASTVPLLPGAQDRASWLPQLLALVRSGSLRLAPGGEVSFQVASARGHVSQWTFRFDSFTAGDFQTPFEAENLGDIPSQVRSPVGSGPATPAGARAHAPSASEASQAAFQLANLKEQPFALLRREPQSPYDLRVQVWLSAELGWLPVRILQQVVPGGDSLEWRLSEASAMNPR